MELYACYVYRRVRLSNDLGWLSFDEVVNVVPEAKTSENYPDLRVWIKFWADLCHRYKWKWVVWICKHIIMAPFQGWAWWFVQTVIRRCHLDNGSVNRNSLKGCNFCGVSSKSSWMNVCCSWKWELIAQCLLPVQLFPNSAYSFNDVFMSWIHYFGHGSESGWAELTISIKKETVTLSGNIWDRHVFTLPSWGHGHFHFWGRVQPANDGKSQVKEKIRLFLSETAICLLVQVWQTRTWSQMTCVIERATESLGLFRGLLLIYSPVKAKHINNKNQNKGIKIITKYQNGSKICWQLEGSRCSKVSCLLALKLTFLCIHLCFHRRFWKMSRLPVCLTSFNALMKFR